MNENFDILLNDAILRCERKITNLSCEPFSRIYPFTTENIAGYINQFNLENKSLLTVGSSCDQVLNAMLLGCKDITVLDINPYTPFYYYLKLSSLCELERKEFLRFLRYVDFPRVFEYNNKVFNKEFYYEIRSTLRLFDYESYLLWDELFQTFKPDDIRCRLFSRDEDRTDVIIKCNPYLHNEEAYKMTREKITNVSIKFINGNIFDYKLDRKYDNIWLSNIGTDLSFDKIKKMTDIMANYLNTNGKLLISYLYSTTKDSKYREGESYIYDIKKTLSVLKKYHPKLISFVGVNGFKFNDNDIKDSVLVYTKH